MEIADRKLRLMEKIMTIQNEKMLKKIETVVKTLKNSENVTKKSAKDFLGIWNNEEGNKIEKAIAEDCENVDLDGWK